MTTKLVTNNFKLFSIEQFTESVTEQSNTAYYLFVGNHQNESNTQIVAEVFDCENDIYHSPYNNMILGKRITANDIKPLIKNIPYVANTVYDMYDHTDTTLSEKSFFVNVDEGSFNHVYKCIDNNSDNPSTVQPTFSHISGANTEFYRTSDGYMWKYMYTFTATEKLKFGTADYIPVVANTTVLNSAIANRIDMVKVEGEGRKYDNYVIGTFSSQDLAIGGNTQIYQISNTVAKNSNGFYTGCLMYLSSGVGAGQYRAVSDYFSNNSGKFAVLATPFDTRPTNSTQYEVYPAVSFKSSGFTSANAVARALVNNQSTNSIYRVEIFNKGSQYDYYAEATVVANNSVGVQSNAELKVILSPYGGHGFNAARELYSKRMEVSVKISNNEANTIPATNQFRQLGIIKDPLFANVSVLLANVSGAYISSEKVYKISPHLIASNATVNSTSNVALLSLDPYRNNLVAGDKLYLFSNNFNAHQLVTLTAVVNSTAIQLSANALVDSTDYAVFKANESTVATSLGSNTTHVLLNELMGTLFSNDTIIGATSGTKATVNSVSRNGYNKTFDTFIGMHIYKGSNISGSFVPNETVYQGNLTTANAVVHSTFTDAANVINMYVTNIKEPIRVGSGRTIVGNTSSAIFYPLSIEYPEINFGSGQILFVENVEPVPRSANTNETFKIIFEY